MTLTLTGSYTENGQSKTVTATQTLAVPAEPFIAPALRIVSASLNGSEVTPLSCSYQVTLNSAASLQVSATVSSEAGVSLGSAGPYSHTASETSPDRSIPLHWTARPSAVTLTLTGTYTENGSTKTVTAAQTLTVPEPPFTDPTLEIVNARIVVPGFELSYNYKLELNDAALLNVSAELGCDIQNDLGDTEHLTFVEDGPIAHSSSETTKLRNVPIIGFIETGEPIILTLTASYQTASGETKTLTVQKEAEYFSLPTIYLDSIDRPGPDLDDVVYSGIVFPGSVDSLELKIELLDGDGDLLATDGPYTLTDTQILDHWSIHADDSSELKLTLRLTGTYVPAEGEAPQTVTASLGLDALPPFEAPEIIINSTSRSGTQVSCEYELTMNSVSEIEITASYYNSRGTLLYSAAPVTQNSGGDFTLSANDASLSNATRIVLTGSYVYRGTPGAVSDQAELAAPFTAPAFDQLRANLDELIAFDSPVDLVVSAQLDVGDANPVAVTVTVVSDQGNLLGEVGPMDYTDSGSIWELISLTLSENESSLTVTLTGVYDQNGTEKTISDSVDVIVTMKPERFDSGGECFIDGAFFVEYWAAFITAPKDPHAGHYDFGVDGLVIFWYDDSDTLLESSDLSGQPITITDDGSGNYNFKANLMVEIYPAAVSKIRVQMDLSDSSTGKTYTTTTPMLPLP